MYLGRAPFRSRWQTTTGLIAGALTLVFAAAPPLSASQTSTKTKPKAAAPAQQPPLPVTSATPPPPRAAASSPYVVTLPGSKEYHWPDCPLVQKARGVSLLLRSQADAKGLKPHKACDPATATDPSLAAATPAVFVYIQDGDNKYHRADCKLLTKAARKVPLDKDAVRGRWPCTVCKPPIRQNPSANAPR